MSSHPSIHASHEHDPRWDAVDHYAIPHLHGRNKALSEVLDKAWKAQTENGLPDIAVSPAQGKFLMLQARMLGVKHALEVGTLGAYSTIWLAHANPDIKITTVEVDAKHAAVAKDSLRAAGVADRVEIIVGSGVDVLPKLVEEVNKGQRERFGFAFIDADKENNWTYFDQAAKMCTPRACLIVDNVVRKGRLADEEAAASDKNIRGAREVIEKVGKDERVDGAVIQTVGEKSYDGFLVAVARDDIVEYVKSQAA
ncbi:uncharacterized protein K452DRAFT_285903 [Aplosporella prunicola CBS 121167]|uniref:O-methyltransferase domain-containing protein n=1 Tax=Aplosporella prunicola CBS 121167 TaxID=1176127 RepID=A0A6A6BKR6_9PEZI|nr:uncharacterized protein K452DRAFT_285903 [Aplosporella prunicola CBS 121167]KAF2143864.1 hypothetical protein K452DRAFT_285903 [Aplosporella prunicola CBS 121167]